LSVFSAQGWAAPAYPLLLIGIWFAFRNSIGVWVGNKVVECIPALKIGEIDLDEEIDTYYNTLDKSSRDWSIKEEENIRNNYKFKILTDESFERMKSAPLPAKNHKVLEGVHTYDLLANPLYLDDFQYVSASLPNREEYIIDDDEDESNDYAQSDMVRVALNLAYLTEDEAKDFEFSKKKFKAFGKIGNFFAAAINKNSNSLV